MLLVGAATGSAPEVRAQGTPASGTPRSGTPGAGTPGAGTPPAGTPPATPTGKNGNLTVYSGRSQSLVGPVLTDFALDDDIKTEVRYASTSELAATLIEEGDRSPASVFFAQDASSLGLLAKEDRFAALPQDLLDRVPARYRSADGMWVGVSGRARVLVYNTEQLKPEELPASVEGLTDPKWAGKVGWAPENASFQSFVTAFRLLKGDDATRSWLEAMIANGTVAFGDSNTPVVVAVGEGELLCGLVNHYYVYAVKRDRGNDFPVANHFFAKGDPGALVNVAGVGLLKSAPDPEQGAKLVDFLLEPKAQAYWASSTFEYPLIAGVPGPEGLPPLDQLGSPDIDLSDLSDLRGTIEMLTEVGLL